ncbi:MAG TPA: 1-(5-phosphoribosyl)-5-[(5-phosphoribosylamino)methylideneamino] imidazole-4-carboxamide isomerase [Gemmatimonadales bacterium]|nr:1-(5-phosphoribosyl)-5-[(5-phosphoribosylamino)methylideneamino] imidazole-4-carboxamide isomerase [Gemmatimonadales bacterium]
MELYPAVDVQGGRVVRVRQGDAQRSTAYAEDPLVVAREFARAGARWVHFVDLDRAFETGENRELTRRFLAAAGLQVQVSGGLHSEAVIAELLTWGATRVVLGTRAATNAALVEQLLARYGAARVAVGIDARNGQATARGQSALFTVSALDLARRVHTQGARTVVYTDVTRDGMLAGPDVERARAIAALGLEVIASGGVASLDDLRRLCAAGLAGAVVGRALYDGRFTLAAALACCAR